MNRADMILKSAGLYLKISKEKQKVIKSLIKANEIESIVKSDILDVDKLNEAVKEIEQIIC
ncbi:hypothetical protein WIR69_19095 (plasmid) [Clostridioides difficile]|uniref:hypothetical protein n=1 Tax=Clostridioides difficile TaxID=1496 RepID=UPI001026C67F|nr:hypothetical protein [Clostridioides difficile]MBH7159848.1 hypothetical protein [Clostridioides difficile]MBY2739933.1 hypothetical protein [Clostridioides difficile]MBZ1182026.1 hypothetical protein [Clostridioides difficile]MCU5807713.1 hypothetical protein [Clostridioides difficile]MDB2793612.1 hypothetical protein [Clostridioides difficile]